MKLHSITLMNFRGVKKQVVNFGDGITVIEGPNEVGKSSITEALRLIRSTKASSKRQEVRAVQPIGTDAPPAVTLRCSSGPYELEYHKQWLSGSGICELSVRGPRSSQHSGDEAHDRFEEILNETLDAELLAALDVTQGKSLDQARLAHINSLKKALGEGEKGKAGEMGGAGEVGKAGEMGEVDELMARIQEEYLRFYTPTGKLNRRVTEPKKQAEALASELDSLYTRSSSMDNLVLLHAEQSGIVFGLEKKRTEAKESLTEAEAAAKKIEDLRLHVAELERDYENRNLAVTSAKHHLAARHDQVKEIAERTTAVGELEESHQAAAAHLAGIQQILDDALAAKEAASKAHTNATSRLRHAERLLSRRRDQIELTRLVKQQEKIVDAQMALAEAKRLLPLVEISQSDLEQLRLLDTNRQLSNKALEAAAATVKVTPLGDHQVQINDQSVRGPDSYDGVIQEPLTILVEGVLTVEIKPGTRPRDLQTQADAALADLSEALTRLGVDGIETAKTLEQQGRESREQIKICVAQLENAKSGAAEDDLANRLEQLRSRLSESEVEPETGDDASTGEAVSIDALEGDVLAKASDAERASEKLARATEAAESATREENEAKNVEVAQAVKLEAAKKELLRENDKLAEARKLENDEALVAARDDAGKKAESAKQKLEEATGRLELMEPERAAAALELAGGNLSRIKRDLDRTREKLLRTEGQLSQLQKEGLYDQIAAVEAELAAKSLESDKLHRQAEAVNLLQSIMTKRQAEAHQKYVEPFKIKIEALGRMVFGRSFEVHITDDLQVAERTLNGVTVPFDSLSAGAREQIALIGRLACAQLIDPDEGAPVILDDTLGFADPKRLTDLGAVIASVGATAQVILLTCQPGRFDGVGDAEVVRLSRHA